MTDLLKRLEEIEAWARDAGPMESINVHTIRPILKLTRSLLESQGELIGVAKDRCVGLPINHNAHRIVARAEKVRKGEV